MKIAYSGKFLLEGLQELGHSLVDISPFGRDRSAEWLEKIPQDADLLLLELYGDRQFPKGIRKLGLPSACYCVDTPLNEFWLRDCAAQCDYIFVDQAASVRRLAEFGLKSAFLPLAARREWFVRPQPKKYDITFVGNINGERVKRKNLLKHIGGYFSLNIASNLSFLECQKLFAQSRIVLNENFFNGLTLRTFQAMASGSPLFTEDAGKAVYDSLNGEDSFLMYNPDNLVPLLDHFLRKPELGDLMGRKAREKCMESHTVSHRAGELLEKISKQETLNPHKSEEERFWRESSGLVRFILRFGGNLGEEIKNLRSMTAWDNEFSGKAMLLLGRIYAQLGKWTEAWKYIREAVESRPSYDAWLNLSLLHLAEKNPVEAGKSFDQALKAADRDEDYKFQDVCGFKDPIHRLYCAIAKTQMAWGRDLDFGFRKALRNPLPETAWEIGQLLWDEGAGGESLEIMRKSLVPYGIEGELLPWLIQAFNAGALNRIQILKTAEIAKSYYDYELAAELLKRAGP